MKFYTYKQRQGDGYRFNAKWGISRFVIVQAQDAVNADWHARKIGIPVGWYDDECYEARWVSAVNAEEYGFADIGTNRPTIMGAVVQPGEERPASIERAWPRAQRPHVFIHYADGRVEAAWG